LRRRSVVEVGAALLLVAGSAEAASLFGGYSNLRLDGANVPGWAVSFHWPLAGSVALVTEATGQYGLTQGEDLKELSVMAGPALAFRPGRRLSPFVHAKAGYVRSRRQVEVFGVAIGRDGVCDGSCPSSGGFAAEAGGGLDLRFDERWAVRLAQIDYRLTTLSEDESDRLRISAGLVFAWGR
jgi:hypothetical protein